MHDSASTTFPTPRQHYIGVTDLETGERDLDPLRPLEKKNGDSSRSDFTLPSDPRESAAALSCPVAARGDSVA